MRSCMLLFTYCSCFFFLGSLASPSYCPLHSSSYSSVLLLRRLLLMGRRLWFLGLLVLCFPLLLLLLGFRRCGMFRVLVRVLVSGACGGLFVLVVSVRLFLVGFFPFWHYSCVVLSLCCLVLVLLPLFLSFFSLFSSLFLFAQCLSFAAYVFSFSCLASLKQLLLVVLCLTSSLSSSSSSLSRFSCPSSLCSILCFLF